MKSNDIIITDQYPYQLLEDNPGYYLNHILCHEGSVKFHVAGSNFEMQSGDMAIFLPQTNIARIDFSDDYRGEHLLLSGRIARINNPSQQWGNRGFLFSFSNPIFHFSKEQIATFQRNLNEFRYRMELTSHLFYEEMLGSCVRTFLYDMWNIYAPELEKRAMSSEGGDLFDRFTSLLSLHSRKQREVKFYAEKLFITPKYLSEVCRKKSGMGAMQWIKNYTRQELTELLKDQNLTINEISDRMNFQNVSFFCRYVKQMLGKTPSEYRNSL